MLVGGFPTASFELTELQMGVNQGTAEAGLIFGPSDDLVLALGVPGLSRYDLGFPAGPFVGTALFRAGQPLATTGGALVFTSFSDEATLTAGAGPGPAVPEPSSLALCGLGAGCLAACARCRRASARPRDGGGTRA